MPDQNYMQVVDTGDHLRKDDGKLRYDLLPPEALEALTGLYTRGAQKYAARGWEEGMTWGRCFAALMRHAWKWAKGEDFDEETGAHHMICVAWNAFALYVYHVRKKGLDDRSIMPKAKSKDVVGALGVFKKGTALPNHHLSCTCQICSLTRDEIPF